MGAYDIFQANPPPVSVSLFGDAAQVGAKLGKEIPSAVTSIIQGGIEGYETGQRIQANDQNAQIRQNQIEQLPVQNERAQLELEQQRQMNEARRLALEKETTNKDLELAAGQAKLQNDISSSRTDTQLRDKTNQLVDNFGSLTPDQQKYELLSGKNAAVFSGKNGTEIFQQLANIAKPNFYQDPVSQAQLDAMMQKVGLRGAHDREYAGNLKKFQDAEYQLFQNDTTDTQNRFLKMGIDPGTGYAHSDLKDVGQYIEDADGTLRRDPVTKQLRLNPEYSRSVTDKTSTYGLVYTDPNTGQARVINRGLDQDFKKTFDSYNLTKNRIDGTYLSTQVNQVDRDLNKKVADIQQNKQPGQQQITANQSQQGLAAPTAVTGVKGEPQPVYISKAVETLKVAPSFVTKNEPLFKQLYESVQQTAPTNESITKELQIRNTIAKGISDNQFNSSEAIRSQITSGYVIKYNKSIRDKALAKANQIPLQYRPKPGYIVEMIAPLEADDPKDIYFAQQQESINNQIYKLILEYSKDKQQTFSNSQPQTLKKLASMLNGN